ncbi:unnamed protein product [Effrenium voratum]|nr:unnamed protein product [Effrenium voratum]
MGALRRQLDQVDHFFGDDRGHGPCSGEKLLSCPESREELMRKASLEENESLTDEKASAVRAIFHATSDFLSNLTSLSTADAAKEIWARIESLLRTEDQVALLQKVSDATSPADLMKLVQQYKWNLPVVEAALGALRDKFPRDLACTDVDVLATRFWGQADGEVKAVVAPHLLHCWDHLETSAASRAVADQAAQLVVDAGRLGGSAAVLPGALKLLLAAAKGGALEGSTELLESLVKALRHAADACYALRELMRADPELSASWVTLKHLEHVENMEAARGSEVCYPSLRADLKRLLTLPALPSDSQLPEPPVVRKATGFERLVGQNCAVKRLMQSPGHVRLRRKGLHRPGVPLVLLMTGPSGTGKTMAARQIAELIHNRPIQELEATGRFRLFPMRMAEDLKTFFGPPRGIQGSGDLPDLVRSHPDAVIVLDEIEKANSGFARALLTVFGEYGTVYDPRTGRDYSASNATFVLTSNLAKELVLRHPAAVAKTEGRCAETKQVLPKGVDGDPDCAAYELLREAVDQELSNPPARQETATSSGRARSGAGSPTSCPFCPSDPRRLPRPCGTSWPPRPRPSLMRLSSTTCSWHGQRRSSPSSRTTTCGSRTRACGR